MAKRTIRYWLVEATKQKATELKITTTNELNDLAAFRKQLAAENPNDFWDICTNECVTMYEDFGVKFQNGRFERL
jgi:hypothetical protein